MYDCPVATNGSDYLAVSTDFVFTAGNSYGAFKCIDIVIIDSPTVEVTETFMVTLTPFNNVARVIITDTDSMYNNNSLAHAALAATYFSI